MQNYRYEKAKVIINKNIKPKRKQKGSKLLLKIYLEVYFIALFDE